ncbi:unnamed protein product, partial [Polarella glacialis]
MAYFQSTRRVVLLSSYIIWRGLCFLDAFCAYGSNGAPTHPIVLLSSYIIWRGLCFLDALCAYGSNGAPTHPRSEGGWDGLLVGEEGVRVSLDIITRQEASKQKRAQGGEGDPAWQGQNQQAMMMQRKPDGMQQAVGGYPKSAADQARAQQKSSFSFNPAAKAFSLNPQAGEFTPSHSGSGGTPVAKAPAHSPSFNVYKKGPETQRKGLTEILEPFFLRARGSTPDSAAPDWPDAKGPSYHEVLGQPNPSSRPLMAPQGCGGQGHMQTMGGGWQPQGQQMMQQVQQPGQQPQQGHQVQQQQGPGDQQGPPMAGM